MKHEPSATVNAQTLAVWGRHDKQNRENACICEVGVSRFPEK